MPFSSLNHLRQPKNIFIVGYEKVHLYSTVYCITEKYKIKALIDSIKSRNFSLSILCTVQETGNMAVLNVNISY